MGDGLAPDVLGGDELRSRIVGVGLPRRRVLFVGLVAPRLPARTGAAGEQFNEGSRRARLDYLINLGSPNRTRLMSAICLTAARMQTSREVRVGLLGDIGWPLIETAKSPAAGRRAPGLRLRGFGSAFAPTLTRKSPRLDRINGASGCAVSVNYFGTPTNNAPVNLPSPPMSGA